jgi:ribosome-binding protein aMBF1 (putative translation factor)
MRCSEPGGMALLGICHRTIHTAQRPQNKAFLLRKPLMETPFSFGERLRLSRVLKGYTQHEIACKFGVSLSAIKFWEQNRHQPDRAVLPRVEAFLYDIPFNAPARI